MVSSYRKGWAASFLFSLLMLTVNKMNYAKAMYDYDDQDLVAGLPIAGCMEENKWEESSFRSIDEYKLNLRALGLLANNNRVVFIPAPIYDAIIECIRYVYGTSPIPNRNKFYAEDKVAFHVGFGLSNGKYVISFLFANVALVNDSHIVNVYTRTPAYPGACDDVTDPVSKKWCMGELTFKNGDPTKNHLCTNSYQDPCGSLYIKGMGGYYPAN